MANYPSCYQMMGYPCSSPMAGYSLESLEAMYPEIYRRVYPKVRDMCIMYDTPANSEMYPVPSRSMVEWMADDIYRRTVMEMGNPDGQFGENDDRQVTPFGAAGFGGGRVLRDLILILLIRQLFRRRRRVF